MKIVTMNGMLKILITYLMKYMNMNLQLIIIGGN